MTIAGAIVAGRSRGVPLRLSSASLGVATKISFGRFLTKVLTSDLLSLRRLLAMLLLFAAPSVCAAASPSIGIATKVENQAQIGGAAAVVGTIIHMNDELTTGAKSHLEVTFRDKTTLTMGENAKVVIDKYVFNPEESTGELLLNTSAAAFRLATGKLGEMHNKQINVSTPVAALAVRGTNFWWGPIKGRQGVLLVSNSKVEVKKDSNESSGCARYTNEQLCGADKFCSWNTNESVCRSCEVTLNKSGEGTYVNRGGCPEEPTQWPPEQIATALSQTSVAPAAGAGAGAAAPAAAGVAGAAGGFIGSTTIKPSSP